VALATANNPLLKAARDFRLDAAYKKYKQNQFEESDYAALLTKWKGAFMNEWAQKELR
jgi:hypothetical protein